jgi:hypothetical protein
MFLRLAPVVGLAVLGLFAAGCAMELPEKVDPPAPPASDHSSNTTVASGQISTNPSAFVGAYNTNFGTLTLVLGDTQQGLVGSYEGREQGRLAGTVAGPRFSFLWRDDVHNVQGHGYFELTNDGVSGRWGYDEDESGQGDWYGFRTQ